MLEVQWIAAGVAFYHVLTTTLHHTTLLALTTTSTLYMPSTWMDMWMMWQKVSSKDIGETKEDSIESDAIKGIISRHCF